MDDPDVRERLSPMALDRSDGEIEVSDARRPSRVPSIKIEPPCDKDSVCDDDASQSSTTTNASMNWNTLSPSMSPSHRPVDLRSQPGNYKKNLTARFLQQGCSEDDNYYRSDSDKDLQPQEKRSKSLDRGLEWDPNEVQPLDLSTSISRSNNDLRTKFEARARKMHRRNRAESEENLNTVSLMTQRTDHLSAMHRLSHSDMQLDQIKHAQPTPSSIIQGVSQTEGVDITQHSSTFESHDRDPVPMSTSPQPIVQLPPIGMMYNNRVSSSGSTDGSIDIDRPSPPYPFIPVSIAAINQAMAANLYNALPDGSGLKHMSAMNYNNLNVAAAATYLEWQQMQNRVNQAIVNQCSICKQTFTGFDNMAKHVAKHLPTEVKTDNNNRVHMCKVCDRSFSRSDMLTRHMRLHTGLKPYECKVCGQVFSRSDHLNTHKRTHTGEKPYQCPKCPYAACRRDMITRHMRIHTTNKDVSRKRGRLLKLKDSASGSSVESSDSFPSRGSVSGNSFDSSFESGDIRFSQRNLLDPAMLVRAHNAKSWSAPNSFDGDSRGRGAWSSMTSVDSTESDSHSRMASFDMDLMPSPPRQNTLSPVTASRSPPGNNFLSTSKAKGLDIKGRRPSLVRQDASLDHDETHTLSNTNKIDQFPSPAGNDAARLPFLDYRHDEYRTNQLNKVADCSEGDGDKDSIGTVDSPRPIESPIPATSDSSPHHLSTPMLPKQASLSDELNLQKCVLNE